MTGNTIYIVTCILDYGGGCQTWTEYFHNLNDAIASYREYVESTNDDPQTVTLVSLNTSTLTEETIESFVGTDADFGGCEWMNAE